MKAKKLRNAVLGVIVQANGAPPDNELANRIDQLLAENELDSDGKIPDWFVQMFDDTNSRVCNSKIYFKYESGTGDVHNFLAELEDIIDADWEDYGEYMKVAIHEMGIVLKISTEDSYYELKQI